MKLYPGIWQIVTGTIKQNESANKAALRELDEETGLRVKRFWTVPVVDSYFDLKKMPYNLYLYLQSKWMLKPICAYLHEHQRYEWLTYSKARERVVWPGQRHAIDIVHEFITGGKEAAGLLEITQF